MSKSNNAKRSQWLLMAIGITIFYIIILFFAMDATKWIMDGSRDCSAENWLAKRFNCLTMNELGDFFAGAFAPLAFVWLVAAVLIQSEELREQRKELQLTRESVDSNREVMKAQATEALRQADYIGQQTQILKAEQNDRHAAQLARIFEGKIEYIVSLWLQCPNALVFYYEGNREKFGVNILAHDMGENNSSQEKIKHLAFYILDQASIKDLLTNDSINNALALDPVGFDRIYASHRELAELYLKLPSETKLTYDAMRIHDLLLLFQDFRLKIGGFPDKEKRVIYHVR